MGGGRGHVVCRLSRGHVVHKLMFHLTFLFLFYVSLYHYFLVVVDVLLEGYLLCLGKLGVLMGCGDQGGWVFLPLESIYGCDAFSLLLYDQLIGFLGFFMFSFIVNLWLQKHFT